MSKIVVLGAGVCGLAAGLLLCRDGHEVVVLERDPEPPPASPEEAWEGWPRDGVTQFRQAHYLTSRGRITLERALPDVLARLEAAGGARFDPLALMPPPLADLGPRDGDDRFPTVTARRPVVELALAQAAEAEPGLDIRRGVTVAGLLVTHYDRTPHVRGVRTDRGEELEADLVVDALGRRSQLPRWLEACEAGPIQEEAEDSGFLYYSRFFRSWGGGLPEFRGPLITPIGTWSLLVLPSDNDTWSVTIYTSAGDRPLKRLRDPETWTAVVGACPLYVQWLEGEPITAVKAMGGILDRYRRLVVDGRPVVTGVALLGDAWACTNPSQGRGVTLGLLHAERLRDVARECLDNPREFAEAWDDVTEAEFAPWYRETVEEDRARLAEIEALRHGLPAPAPAGATAALRNALLAAVPQDPDAFRAYVASRNCLRLQEEIFADEEFVERILELAEAAEPRSLAGPDREALLAILAAAPAAA